MKYLFNKYFTKSQQIFLENYLITILIGLSIILLIILLLCISIIGTAKNRYILLGQDFRAFYTGGIMLQHQENKTFYNLQTQYAWQKTFSAPEVHQFEQVMPFNYPAIVAIPFFVLSYLKVGQAYIIWGIINIILFIIISILLLKMIPSKNLLLKCFLLAYILIFPPAWGAVIGGQLSMLLTLSLIGAWYALKKGKEKKTGMWLGFLVIRTHLIAIPLLMVLYTKKWKIFFSMALTIIGILSISIILTSVSQIYVYSHLLNNTLNWGDKFDIHPSFEPTLKGFLHILYKTNYTKNLLIPWIIGDIVIVSILLWIWKACNKMEGSKFDLLFTTTIFAMLITSPHTNYHDLTLLLIPLALLIRYVIIQKRYIIPLLSIIIFWSLAIYIEITPLPNNIKIVSLVMGEVISFIIVSIIISRLKMYSLKD